MGQLLDEGTPSSYFPTLTKSKATFEEYLQWDSESAYNEWVDGEIVFLPSPTLQHQTVVGFLQVLLYGFNESHQLGKIVQVPFAMKLPSLNRSRVPDLLFVRKEREHLFAKNYLNGPADAVVEVISPGTGSTDRGDKFFEYEEAGVQEYWLIDPERQHAEFYRLGEDKLYHTVNLEADNIFRSETIKGFWFPVHWLWNIPNELDALRELGVDLKARTSSVACGCDYVWGMSLANATVSSNLSITAMHQ